MNNNLLIELLDRAQSEELGITVETDNPGGLLKKLQALLQSDQKYSNLVILLSTKKNEVFIAKQIESLADELP